MRRGHKQKRDKGDNDLSPDDLQVAVIHPTGQQLTLYFAQTHFFHFQFPTARSPKGTHTHTLDAALEITPSQKTLDQVSFDTLPSFKLLPQM